MDTIPVWLAGDGEFYSTTTAGRPLRVPPPLHSIAELNGWIGERGSVVTFHRVSDKRYRIVCTDDPTRFEFKIR